MIKRIWSGVTTAAVIVMIILAVLLAGARLVGLQVYTVLSGSMEPNYPVGSLIYVKKVDPQSLKVGDAISFVIGDHTVATHRIVEVIPDEKTPDVIRFRTKGDNNDVADENSVHSANVQGKVVGHLPLLGYVANFVQHPPGTYIALIGALAVALAVFLPDIITNAKALKQEKQQLPPSEENSRLKAELEALRKQLQQQTAKQETENGETGREAAPPQEQ